jgi:hypothetical protein
MDYNNIYLPVQNLQRTTINHFGLCWILFFKHADILSWPGMDHVNGVINSSLVFKDSTSFFTAQFLEKDRIFTEAQKQSQAGPWVESVITGILGGNNLNHITGIQAMIGEKFGLLIQERNGEQRLIGSPDAGAAFSWDYTSGNDTNSRKRNCKWMFESAYPVPIYQGGSVVINNTIIPVGGSGGSGGSGNFSLLTRFNVGTSGMSGGDTTFTDAGLLNKNVLVFADGTKITQSPTPLITKRTITKVFNSDTITFNGGVADLETIEVFTF